MSRPSPDAGAITCRRLLVPVDETAESTATVIGAVELARMGGASITFVHAPHLFAPDDEEGPAFPLAVPCRLPSGSREVLAKAESIARAQGVPCASATATSEVAHNAILVAAQETDSDLILLGIRSRHPAPLALAVLARTTIPVLIQPVSPSASPHPIIHFIRDEHRAVSAVLRAWQGLLIAAMDDGTAADAPLMRSMTTLLETSLAAPHHAWKEKVFFGRLRRRTSTVAADLDELVRQLARQRQLIEALGEAVERYSAGAPVAELAQTVDNFAQFIWEHHGREEGVVLTAAQRYLSDEDWNDIDAAFRAMAAGFPGGAPIGAERGTPSVVEGACDPAQP